MADVIRYKQCRRAMITNGIVYAVKDERYLLCIMRHKLKHMEEHFRYHSWAESSEKDADNIKHAIEILDKLIADRYLFEAENVEEGYELREGCTGAFYVFEQAHKRVVGLMRLWTCMSIAVNV